MPTIMEALDPAAEWLRLSERYRQMSDHELLALARDNSDLTDVAQQALAQEISQRRLKLQPEEPPAPPNPEPPPGSSSSYAEDRELVEIAPCGVCRTRFSCKRCWRGREFRFSWDRRELRA